MSQKNKAREYTRTTLRRLDTLSGNLCAKPGCPKQLIGEDEKSIVSKICHIEAASPGGARYNSEMTDDDRRHYDNLILLCDEHHVLIDNTENEKEYSVELLKKWKRDHELKMLQKKMEERPSLLGEAINAIAEIDIRDGESELSQPKAFKILQKIEYNNIIEYRHVIDYYKVYSGKIEKIYREMDKQGSSKKNKLLNNIQLIYLKVKGKYTNGQGSIEDVRKNADKIIKDVEEEILSKINEETHNSHYREDVDSAVMLIMVDAFMRCKILEEPKS